jgi:hypothetical protein
MAVTINGTSGIAVPLGSASAPAETNTTSATTGIYYPSSTTLGLSTNGTNAVTIDASQNVGIGTTSPNTKLQVYKAAASSFTGTSPGALIVTDSTNTLNYFTSIDFNTTSSSSIPFARIGMGYTSNGSTLNFGTSNSYASGITNTAMTIDPTGDLLVKTATILTANTHSFVNSGAAPLSLRNSNSTAGRFWVVGPDSGSNYITYNDSSTGAYIAYGGTSWTANSDERLKTDLIPIENATSKVSMLRAVTGRFKADEEGTSRAFLIAQDVQAVLPEAVDSTNPDKLGVSYTEVIPLLVAAIKELSAEVEALKSKVGA